MHVVVTGLMGVGKSTTAGALADALALGHRDSDADLRRLFDATGSELAERYGVAELHRLEAAVLLGALASETATVISAAASVVEDPRCREALGVGATVVVLTAPLDIVIGRIASGAHRRPIDRGELERLATRRAPLFDEVADVVVDATDEPAMVVSAICEQL